MKKLAVVILLLIGAACVVLIYVGKDVSEMSSGSTGDGIPGGGGVKKLIFSESPLTSGEAASPKDKTAGTVDGTAVATAEIPSAMSRSADARAEKLIAVARRFLMEGDPEGAQAELDIVRNLPCSTAVRKKAKSIAEKELVVYSVVFDTEPEPAEGLRTYELRGGGKVRGWVVSENDDDVTVKVEGGGQTVLSRSDISRVNLVSDEERSAKIKDDYGIRKARLADNDAMGHYNLAMFCRTKGMTDLAVRHIESALKINPELHESVRDKDARKLYMMAVWFGSMGEADRKKEWVIRLKEKFPDSKYVAIIVEEEAEEKARRAEEKKQRLVALNAEKKAREDTAERERVAVVRKKESAKVSAVARTAVRRTPPKVRKTTVSETEAEGDKLYEKGLEHSRRAMPFMGTRKFAKENTLALKAFENAMKQYEKAKRQGKASSGIEDKIAQANSMKYGCFKMSRVE